MEALNKCLGKEKCPTKGHVQQKKVLQKKNSWGLGKGFSAAIFGDIAFDFGLGLNTPPYGKNIF